MEIVLLGHMGRDEALAERLRGHTLHVIGEWKNPGLVDKAHASGGNFDVINNITNVELVASYVQAVEPDMFITNFDDALAAGVVDAIRRRVDTKRMPNLLIPCPDKSAAKVEWDKFYLRDLINEINPSFNPVNFMVETSEEANEAIAYFQDRGIEMALKPRNLTGGKGVKVQGKHFESYEEARLYAHEVLGAANQSGLEVQEKLNGYEFTLQLFTDGKTLVRPPVTYDYPYREDGDVGPGTGGMGTFSLKPNDVLPFMEPEDYEQAITLMEQILQAMKERGDDYKGILYPTIFKTSKGLKIVEINARGGDPELINILDVLDDNVDVAEVLQSIATGELCEDSVRFKKMASAMLYLVSPEYGYGKGPVYEFGMDPTLAQQFDAKVRFAAAEKVGPRRYKTVGSSRSVGISAVAETPWAAREKIHAFIRTCFDQPLALDYREEVGKEAYIIDLSI